MKYVYVAGTNGKGSVCYKIAKSLELLGFRVGLYSSPHISCPSERIQINGIPINPKYVRDIPHIQPAFFNQMTDTAFAYFEENYCDYAVIEAGIGAKGDRTNRMIPAVSVITSLGFDHMEMLGETLDEIAEEKSGAIKPGVPVILGPSADHVIFKEKASYFRVAPHMPTFEEENQETAKLALFELGFPPNEGILKTPACRFEVLGNVIFDVAHNTQAIERTLAQIEGELNVVYGASKRDNAKRCLPLLTERASRVAVVRSNHPFLAEISGNFPTYHSMAEEKKLAENKTLLVCGSFYIMHDLRKSLLDSDLK
ncbi:MAG: hypothetical protein SP1CHLAM54_05310 [Chlamydiia bacterium]|nr:hypothetical protein [Chlamydiia bacterium]MCH9615443.1 hypothetical protein [Chlamydiia bacterium]MCH9628235.1 hypothetical protein [Chlamydiia bacterium]